MVNRGLCDMVAAPTGGERCPYAIGIRQVESLVRVAIVGGLHNLRHNRLLCHKLQNTVRDCSFPKRERMRSVVHLPRPQRSDAFLSKVVDASGAQTSIGRSAIKGLAPLKQQHQHYPRSNCLSEEPEVQYDKNSLMPTELAPRCSLKLLPNVRWTEMRTDM